MVGGEDSATVGDYYYSALRKLLWAIWVQKLVSVFGLSLIR